HRHCREQRRQTDCEHGFLHPESFGIFLPLALACESRNAQSIARFRHRTKSGSIGPRREAVAPPPRGRNALPAGFAGLSRISNMRTVMPSREVITWREFVRLH